MNANKEAQMRTVAARIVQDKEKMLEQLKKTPIVQIACEKSDISRSTYYRWIAADPEFAKLSDEAIHEGNQKINDVAESQLILAIQERNMTAILFWLKHHHPAYTTKVEIMAHLNQPNDLTTEQQALVQEALRRAALPKSDALTFPDERVNRKAE